MLEDILERAFHPDKENSLEVKKPEVLVEEVEFGDLGLNEFVLDHEGKGEKAQDGIIQMRSTVEECE